MQNLNYEVVPDIITGKDLDYLSDMFQWNYGALKQVNAAMDSITDQQIKDIMQKSYHVFENNLNQVLNILNQGGSNE